MGFPWVGVAVAAGRAGTGDGDALGAVFDRHRDRVFLHWPNLVRSGDAAEELTAMLFYEEWRLYRDFLGRLPRPANSSDVAELFGDAWQPLASSGEP